MMVEYLAGNRIRGTKEQRGKTLSPDIGGWKLLGRTKLTSAGDAITVSNIPNKRYYMVLTKFGASANHIRGNWRFNADTGTNYANRRSTNGAADSTEVSASLIQFTQQISGSNEVFGVHYIANLQNKEKLTIDNIVGSNTAGAANAPIRSEVVGKWANTTDAINEIRVHNDDTSDYTIGSECVVLGWDENDTHSTNFWQPLADVDLSGGAADVIDSGIFEHKKYLWVQYYIQPSTTTITNCLMTFNSDTGNNYARRISGNGGSDTTNISQPNIHIRASTSTYPYFAEAFIVNNATEEKLTTASVVGQVGTGAGTAPEREEIVGKWTNTTDLINKITLTNDQVGVDFDTKSRMIVWGAN